MRSYVRQLDKRGFLRRVQDSRNMVDHAQRAEIQAVQDDRRASIEPDVRFSADQNVVAKSWIQVSIGHFEKVGSVHGMRAKRMLVGQLAGAIKTHAGLEPMTILVGEAEHGHGRSRDQRSGTRQGVKKGLRVAVEDAQLA